MYRFIEAIRIENSQVFLLDLHQERMDKVFFYFRKKNPYNLENYFQEQNHKKKGLYKWRIIYDLQGNISFQIIPYTIKIHNNFELVNGSSINYCFKYEDRSEINKLKNHSGSETIFFYQNKKITDTSYSNLIFKKNQEWYTPDTFLLNGVMRQHLLRIKKIKTLDINLENLNKFSHFQMINSMIPFGSYEYSIKTIHNLFKY